MRERAETGRGAEKVCVRESGARGVREKHRKKGRQRDSGRGTRDGERTRGGGGGGVRGVERKKKQGAGKGEKGANRAVPFVTSRDQNRRHLLTKTCSCTVRVTWFTSMMYEGNTAALDLIATNGLALSHRRQKCCTDLECSTSVLLYAHRAQDGHLDSPTAPEFCRDSSLLIYVHRDHKDY